MTRRKNVLIPAEIFTKLALFFLADDPDGREEIAAYLEKKLDLMVMHDLYSTYKTNPSDEERRKAIDRYLDKKGVPESFRY